MKIDWPLVELGDIFAIARGGSPRPIQKFLTDDPDGVNWIMISDATEGSKYITSTKKKIIHEGVKRSRMVEDGDFLLTNSMSFGKPYIMKTKGCIHDGWLVLSPKSKNINIDYFYHLLGSQLIYLEFERRAAGATVKNLNIELVKSVQIPLPPLPEQQRIAAILDKADALRAQRRATLAKLDTLLQATFLHLFGDPVTNPMGWERKRLDDCSIAVIDCPHTTPKWKTEGVICLRTSNLSVGGWDWTDTRYISEKDHQIRTKRSEIFPGDIILSREGTVGIAAIVQPGMKVSMGQRLVQVRPNTEVVTSEFALRFLLYELDPERIQYIMAGSTSKHLNVRDLRDLEISVPPICLQEKFTRIATKIEAQRNVYRKTMNQLDNLFHALQQRAFKGEL